MNIQEAEVIKIEKVGIGTRICIDVVDNLDPLEGALVGNTGHGYLMVLSENRSTKTYPARPFRINCGALHQYIYLGEEQTIYLSEMKPGMRLPIVNKGQARMVAVGRVKAEKRELIRVVCKIADKEISATLQASDSVHVLSNKLAQSVETLELGDKILCLPDEPGRHLGKKIEEEIWEI
ncbi:3-dehydroquinate synthase II [Radiobacillus sp. PE A8.2]|uniref:3-dehydroquinate synthase II n=1 Tax=Radiobacillus sp. PE A8.2 TaxID=3380349 RepID=UPI00388D9043